MNKHEQDSQSDKKTYKKTMLETMQSFCDRNNSDESLFQDCYDQYNKYTYHVSICQNFHSQKKQVRRASDFLVISISCLTSLPVEVIDYRIQMVLIPITVTLICQLVKECQNFTSREKNHRINKRLLELDQWKGDWYNEFHLLDGEKYSDEAFAKVIKNKREQLQTIAEKMLNLEREL